MIVFSKKAQVEGSAIDIAIDRQHELEAKRAMEGDVTLEAQT